MHRNRNRRKGPPEGRSVQNVLSTDGIPPGTFAVIDPLSKRLFIPLESMLDTRAMHRKGVPSLCRVFLEGRCRQGTNCFQAHANIDLVLELRAKALAVPTCCALHGSPSDMSGIDPTLRLVVRNDDGETVGLARLRQALVTNGLRTLIAAQVSAVGMPAPVDVVVSTAALCRSHSGADGSPCCRFEGECNFVHLCRHVVAQINQRREAVKAEEHLAAPVLAVGKHSETCQDEFMTVPDMASNRPTSSPLQLRSQPASTVMVPMSVSANLGVTPSIRFDPLALAVTAPSAMPDSGALLMGRSPLMSRSFSSTPSGLVWRHNPYNSSHASSVIET
ncbi:hypothetical protein LPMP_283100 [Leishmania panamensis]|uniref:C3H1-type domain-containing protein n=1 Tax=Leishmania panamensis TaxID=5679 RepID=A0A088RUU8_LEIPA|nr:hypothetical protein LPMP_283100 [Leishmania panamensis]AIN99942.1 hypothetical protein LPMP_283100 [Leishmania panamensis]